MTESGIPVEEAGLIADRMGGHFTEWRESTFPGLLGNVVAGRIANRLNLNGTNFTADAACASSLAALKYAMQELWLGDSDLVLSGGADALNNIFMYMCFSKTPAMSASGVCRPFSSDADGTLMGEGCGILALRRLSDAERDGNTIYGVIRGIGSSSDGSGTSVYAPRPGGQSLALERAYRMAGYSPRTVGLVEAHGTGTRAGDAAEFAGLNAVFGAEAGGAERWCALGSVKSQIGHTKSAAGAAGMIKALFALHHKVLPPTINVSRPNERLDLTDSPFYLNTQTRPWFRSGDTPRRASVSSFGFGGSNFHVTLEEYLGDGKRPHKLRAAPAELFLLSAPTLQALQEKADDLCRSIAGDDDLAHYAMQAADAFRSADGCRLAIVAGSVQELNDRIEQSFAEMDQNGNASTLDAVLRTGEQATGQVAFLFAGQGSQYVGMGADLALHFDCARAVWEYVDGLRDPSLEPLSGIVFPHPAFDSDAVTAQSQKLTATENAQPAIAAVSLSHLALLEKLGLVPDCVAGHSFGEIMSLHAAGVFDAQSAMQIADARGVAMAKAAGNTNAGMLAVAAGKDAVDTILSALDAEISIANDNAADQVILSGTDKALAAAAEALKANGLHAVRLSVSTAFHSPIVAEASRSLSEALSDTAFHAPRLPVYANSTARPYPSGPEDIRQIVSQQLSQPVRFRELIDNLYADGVRTFVEIGPGSVVTKLVHKNLRDKPHIAVSLDDARENGLRSLLRAVGCLLAHGHSIDTTWLWHEAQPEAPKPAPAKHALWLNGANYKKPYPPTEPVKGDIRKACDRDERTAASVKQSQPVVRALGAHSGSPAAGAAASDAWSTSDRTGQASVAATTVSSPESGPAVQSVTSPPAEGDPAVAVRDVIADKTGYPPEMLGPDMDLEGELGIDSIKQVEILSALRERLPAMPEIAPEQLAELRSIGQIVAAIGGTRPAAAPQPVATQAQAAEAAVPPIASPPPAEGDPTAAVRDVIADKTGYPPAMLGPDMDLEGELGIDSIKQVEILSALRERLPAMPEIAPEQLAELRSIGQIVAAIGGTRPAAAPQPVATPVHAAEAAVPSIASPMPAESDPIVAVRDVIADKTGYPPEMLGPDMDLEGELGIDSIKQVEILSALRERLPAMPEIAPEQLAELRSIGQIVAAIGGARQAVSELGAWSNQVETSPVLAMSTTLPSERSALPSHGDMKALLRQRVELMESRKGGAAPDWLDNSVSVGITDCAPELADRLVTAFESRSVRARLVGEDVPADIGVIVVTSGLSDRLASHEIHLRALRVARSVAARFSEQGGAFVTLQDTGGQFGRSLTDVHRACSGGLTGLAKTVVQEWPRTRAKAIDIECDGADVDTVSGRIVDEILNGGDEIEVGLTADGLRLIPYCVVAEPDASAATDAVAAGGVVVVTGGGRGITARIVADLAAQGPFRFAIFGRTKLVEWPEGLARSAPETEIRTFLARRAFSGGDTPSPKAISAAAGRILASQEIRDTLETIRTAGAEADYWDTDVTDFLEVMSRISAVRHKWGPICGIVHGAGVRADKMIQHKTDGQFLSVFQTKIAGLLALMSACEADPLKFIFLFSSVAGRFGNAGQADYAMANESLNRAAWALKNRRPDCHVAAINWGPWQGGMVDDQMRALFEERGVPVIPLESGVAAFRHELLHAADKHPEIVIAGRQQSEPLAAE